MRWLVSILVAALAAPAFAGIGVEDARHLLLRTEFGAAPERVAEFAKLNRSQAVDRLLSETTSQAKSRSPAWVDSLPERPRKPAELTAEERKIYARNLIEKGTELKGWWLEEMLKTTSPLTERMTLFWHNHFVSSLQKVRVPQLMYRQNQLLRSEALGNYGRLLKSVARDPAMVVYLDSARNRKDAPNENFAREVMELFTMGEGSGYSERDIKEAARAFTGWSLDRNTNEFRFYRMLHDNGVKTVLGRSGQLDGDDVLEILLEQPATASFITAKLWKEFISPNPDKAEVKRMANLFRGAGYEIKPLLRAMLLSDAFWALENRAVLVKSPVEFIVGTLNAFQISGMNPRLLALSARQLGQDVFAPPNVKGWPGGESWINANTLLARNQIIERFFRGQDMVSTGGEGTPLRRAMRMPGSRASLNMEPEQWFEGFSGDEASRRSKFLQHVLAVPVDSLPGDQTSRLDFARLVALDPAWNLK